MNGRKLIPGKPMPAVGNSRLFDPPRHARRGLRRPVPAAPQAHRRTRQAIRRTSGGQHLLRRPRRTATPISLRPRPRPGSPQRLARRAVQGAPARSRRQCGPQRAAGAVVEPDGSNITASTSCRTPIPPNASISSKESFRGGCTCSPAIPARSSLGSSAGAPSLRSTSFMSTAATPSDVCRSDMGNCIRIASGQRGRHLLLDDVHASWIFDVYCEFVSRGDLTTETFFGDWEEAGPQRAGPDRVSLGRSKESVFAHDATALRRRLRIRLLLARDPQSVRLRVPRLVPASRRELARLQLRSAPRPASRRAPRGRAGDLPRRDRLPAASSPTASRRSRPSPTCSATG